MCNEDSLNPISFLMCLLPIDHANENSDPVWNPLLFSTSYGQGTQPLSVYTALFNTFKKKKTRRLFQNLQKRKLKLRKAERKVKGRHKSHKRN